MRSISIENIKGLTTHLFARDTFDDFLVAEASFSTAVNITIDGHLNMDFLDENEQELPENREGVICWEKLRALCYEIIKGRKIPLRFKLVFMLPSGYLSRFLQKTGLDYDPEKVHALFLNFTFQEGKLVCTTGTSLKEFTLDKSLEYAWDEETEKLLNRIQSQN